MAQVVENLLGDSMSLVFSMEICLCVYVCMYKYTYT
jgi:hypothetical protein